MRARFLATFALLAPLGGLAAEPHGPAAPFREARLTGRVRNAAGVAFPLGAGRYAFTSGTLSEIAAADDTPIGFFFEGKGTLAWRVEEPEASRVFGENAKRLGGFDVAKDGTLTAVFTRASFWLSPPAIPALDGFAAGETDTDAFARHRQRFARDQMTPPAFGLAAARLESRASASVVLEGKRDIRHEIDPLFSGEERLAVVAAMEAAPVGFIDWRLARMVGALPIGKALPEAPDVPVVLTGLDVDVRETEDGYGDLAVAETFVPRREVRSLALELASDTLGHRGLSARPTTLTSVTDSAGRELAYAFGKDALLVVLAEKAPAGAPLKLRFAYRAGFFEPQLGSNAWELALAQGWYPAPHGFRSGCLFTYHAVVRAKKPLLAFTSGETVRRAEDGAWNLLETRMTTPVAMVGVLAGPYTVQEERQEGLTLRIASYALPKPKASARLFELLALFRAHYERLLGPFPWKEVTIAETTSFGAGQATPGLILATREAFFFRPRRTRDDHLLPEGIDRHIAHEMAHSWFGYRFWGASEKDQWLEEAFAEFGAAHAIEVLGDTSEAHRIVNVWKVRADESRKEAPIWLADEMSDKASLQPSHDSGRDRYALVYFKGAWLLQALRKELGDERFFGAVRGFLDTHPGAASTGDLVAFLTERTGRDWRPWFARSFYGREMP